MLSATLTLLAMAGACLIVWFGFRRIRAVQTVSGHLSGPVAQMQEQILLAADSAVDRLDDKIAQMEILLAEIDRRATALAQHSQQHQLRQLQLEQQQQQLMDWLQKQKQQMERDFEAKQQMIAKLQERNSVSVVSVTAPPSPSAVPSFVSEPAPAVAQPKPASAQKNALAAKTVRPPEPIAAASLPVRERLQAVPAKPVGQDKRTAILEMVEQGYSVSDIAQTIGIGKGEVMLLLKLRKKTAP